MTRQILPFLSSWGCSSQDKTDKTIQIPLYVPRQAASGTTATASFTLKQMLRKRREHGLETWVLFVDLVKAFDCVPRSVAEDILSELRKQGA